MRWNVTTIKLYTWKVSDKKHRTNLSFQMAFRCSQLKLLVNCKICIFRKFAHIQYIYICIYIHIHIHKHTYIYIDKDQGTISRFLVRFHRALILNLYIQQGAYMEIWQGSPLGMHETDYCWQFILFNTQMGSTYPHLSYVLTVLNIDNKTDDKRMYIKVVDIFVNYYKIREIILSLKE